MRWRNAWRSPETRPELNRVAWRVNPPVSRVVQYGQLRLPVHGRAVFFLEFS